MVFIKRRKKKTAEEIAAEKEIEKQRALGLQDEFQVRGFEFVTWISDNKEKVLGLVGLVLLGTLAWSGYAIYSNSQSEKASALYMSAIDKLDAMESEIDAQKEKKDEKAQKEEVISTLKSVWENYPKSGVAQMARLYAGNLYLNMGQPKEALPVFDSFLQSATKSDRLKLLGMLGVAYSSANAGDLQRSLGVFEQILDEKWEVSEDLVTWEAASLAKRVNAFDKARTLAEQLKQKFPTSSYAGEADALLASLPVEKK